MPRRVCAAQASSDGERSNDWFAERESARDANHLPVVGRAQPVNSLFAARAARRERRIVERSLNHEYNGKKWFTTRHFLLMTIHRFD